MTQATTTTRPVPRWLDPVVWWVIAGVILAFCAVSYVHNINQGHPGSKVAVPLKAPKPPTVQTTLQAPVDVMFTSSTSTARVLRFTPISVHEGSMSDFNLSNPAEMAGIKVYYIYYTVSYVSGSVMPGPIQNHLHIDTGKGKPPVAPPNGMKNWNASGCDQPQLTKNFTMGAGTTLHVCDVSFVPQATVATRIQLDSTGAFWPING